MGVDVADDKFLNSKRVSAMMAVIRLYSIAFQRRELLTPCCVPDEGPALVVANHTAGLDPIVIQSSCKRPIFWIMDKAYYEQKSLMWLLRWAHMIPIDRTQPDSGAWRFALKTLRAGHVVGVFPEGRIERERELMPFQPGIAMLAASQGVPVCPIYIDGPQRNRSMLRCYLTRQRPTLRWGTLTPTKKQKLSRDGQVEWTAELQASIEALKQQM